MGLLFFKKVYNRIMKEKYICPICGKEFKNKNSLNSHLTFHENEKKYPNGITCPLCGKHSSSLKGFYRHISIFHKDYKDKVYLYRFLTNDNDKHLCKVCGKEAILKEVSKGFEDYCSEECRQILVRQHFEEAQLKKDYSSIDYSSAVEKRIITNIKKYGCKNPSQNEEIKNKIKKTNLEKYGFEYGLSNSDIIEKRKKTNLIKYGSESPLKNKDVRNKIKSTVKEKYNVDNVFQAKDVKDRSTKSIKDRYGVDNVSKSNEIKQRKVATNIKNLGVEYPVQSEVVQHKIKETCLNKYDKESFFQTEEFKDKMNKTYLEKYGQAFSDGIPESILNRIKETNLEKYGVEFAISSKEVRDKIVNTFKDKYGVTTPFELKDVKEKSLRTIYNKIIERYSKTIDPLFSFEDWKNRKSNGGLLKWKCRKCGTVFEALLYEGKTPRCLKCYPIAHGFSNMEKEVVSFLKSFNITVIENDRKILSPQELDIYLPDYNLAIEFDGLFWHSELSNKGKYYHINKTNKCNDKNIDLIHIFENEWVENQDIVKSIILSRLGIFEKKIGARKCNIRGVSYKDANDFYLNNHIQGISKQITLSYGLYYKDKLVSCISYGKSRFNKKYDYELLRFASLLNTQIMGSFGKLWKYKPAGNIITYSDKRYFNGTVYRKYFVQLEDTEPSYFYFRKDNKLESRIKYQKFKLKNILKNYDENLTEWQNMQNNGFNRIWDCGNFKFEYIEK